MSNLNNNLPIRIATRQSPLALWQAKMIAYKIKAKYQKTKVYLVPLVTQGDQILDRSLADIGGKAVFVNNLEQALLEKRADIAVHSLKDVPCELDDRFCLPMFAKRDKPNDVLLSKDFTDFGDLSKASVIGTCSPRRKAQLMALGFKNIKLLRGNITRRIHKLNSAEYDAIILAYAGLSRLGVKSLIDYTFPIEQLLPAPGQGVVAVECLAQRPDLIRKLSALSDVKTQREVILERKVSAALEGDCHSPIGMYAQLIDEGKNKNKKYDQVLLKALVASENGDQIIRYEKILDDQDSKQVQLFIDALVRRGAKKILAG